jgi:ubiquinone/menaquinone biosynthesis C-methylase UbiE/uncharacterized protein YbaR (Trm112 family)
MGPNPVQPARSSAVISPHLVDMLRCPISHEPLIQDGVDALRTQSVRHPVRYRIIEGIPVLLAPEPPYGGEQTGAIISAFATRAQTYFQENYASGANPDREHRRERVASLLAARLTPGALVLDAGAGPAIFRDVIEGGRGRYLALDLSVSNLLAGRARDGAFDSVVASITAMPFADNVVDGVLAIGCLEYVPDWRKGIREIVRITRPGGFIIATFPNSASPRRLWDEAVIHPISRARQRRHGLGIRVYRRSLMRVSLVARELSAAGARPEIIEYLNPGLFGYPLSNSALLSALQRRLLPRLTSGPLASEFVIAAVKAVAHEQA